MSDTALGTSPAGTDRPLLEHEVRRNGRLVATLRMRRTEAGATVDSHVYPITEDLGGEGLKRPFAFSSVDHARRFIDEALVAFEYLNCTVA